MCIIIDANKMNGILPDSPDQDAAPIRNWLRKKGGKIVYSTGGKFATEIGGHARERLTLYARSGQAIQIDADARRFRDCESSLANDGIKSDDSHVLALAWASGARLLYTGDADLMDDFKDKRFIDKPRGKVYRYRTHAKTLLTRSTCKRVTAGD